MFWVGVLALAIICEDLNLEGVKIQSLQIVDMEEIEGGLNAHFSQEGKLVYEREVPSPLNEIWIMDVRSGEKEKVGGGRNPKLSPNGDKILYEGGVYGESDGVWKMNLDGTDARSLVRNEEGRGFYTHPNWFPSGERIVFALYDEAVRKSRGLFVADDTGCNKMQLTSIGVLPTPSPLGTHIAFWVNELRGKNGLWVIDEAGESRRLMVIPYKPNLSPPSICWVEEGKVLYASGGVWLLDVKSGEKKLISKEGYCACPSPNFKLIAYIDEDGLWIVDKEGKERVFLKEVNGGEPAQIEWSKNARYIAYSYLSPGGKQRLVLVKLAVFMGRMFEVSCGVEQGVKRGMRLCVYGEKVSPFTGEKRRDVRNFKGEIEVESVFQNRSICMRRKPGYPPIKVGDFVIGKLVRGFVTKIVGDSLR